MKNDEVTKMLVDAAFELAESITAELCRKLKRIGDVPFSRMECWVQRDPGLAPVRDAIYRNVHTAMRTQLSAAVHAVDLPCDMNAPEFELFEVGVEKELMAKLDTPLYPESLPDAPDADPVNLRVFKHLTLRDIAVLDQIMGHISGAHVKNILGLLQALMMTTPANGPEGSADRFEAKVREWTAMLADTRFAVALPRCTRAMADSDYDKIAACFMGKHGKSVEAATEMMDELVAIGAGIPQSCHSEIVRDCMDNGTDVLDAVQARIPEDPALKHRFEKTISILMRMREEARRGIVRQLRGCVDVAKVPSVGVGA